MYKLRCLNPRSSRIAACHPEAERWRLSIRSQAVHVRCNTFDLVLRTKTPGKGAATLHAAAQQIATKQGFDNCSGAPQWTAIRTQGQGYWPEDIVGKANVDLNLSALLRHTSTVHKGCK